MGIFKIPITKIPDLARQETSGALDGAEDALETVTEAASVTIDILQFLLWIAAGAALALLAGVILLGIGRIFTRRHTTIRLFLQSVYRPLQVLLLVVGMWIGFGIFRDHALKDEPSGALPLWLGYLDHAFLIALILAAAWLVVGVLNGIQDAIHERIRESSERRAARVKTQMQILHRVGVVIVWILGFAGVLLTFPAARTVGASLLASAGLVSVVAGLAAQTTLSNVFAGLQLAFSDSIRVGDIVFYENSYTTVEEITLTYVVLAVWDGRRIIVPSSLLTTQSFENWTRRAPEMTGTIEIDVDWAVPVAAARKALKAILLETELWDGKTGVLQVSDAINGIVRLRIVVSAKNSPTLTDLRNYVREKMVVWIQHEAPQAIPHNYNWDYEPANFEKAERLSFEKAEERLQAALPASYLSKEQTRVLSSAEMKGLQENITMIDPAQTRAETELAKRARAADSESHDEDSALFSGSAEADERQKHFAGPGEEAYADRQKQLERNTGVISKAEVESELARIAE